MNHITKPPQAALPAYMPLKTKRVVEAMSVSQAISLNPAVGGLVQRAAQSAAYIHLIKPLVAPSLLRGIRPGPLDNGVWCLLAANSAVAAKLRQLAPALAAHLCSKGHKLQDIRIKIMM